MVEHNGFIYQQDYLRLYDPVIYNIHSWEEVCKMYDYELELALLITEHKKEALSSAFDMLGGV